MNRDDNRTLLLVVLAVILVVVLVPVLMMSLLMGGGLMLGGMMGGGNGSGLTWQTGAGMLVISMLVIGGLAALGAWVVQRLLAAGGRGGGPEDPQAIPGATLHPGRPVAGAVRANEA